VFASRFTATQLYLNGAGLGAATASIQCGLHLTITNVALTGAGGQLITLRSTTPGAAWSLNNTTANSVTFVDARIPTRG